ncbi:extracellular solute-binding protein [Nonomuraea phyllanthi]|uniref:extracellular solute-binding protein n=1 Tax=Nonomuraea phyllanthi TaxID=2219224 RepID=UPI001293B7BB|nr:extracellular solute-binding protein [Nonomuraea phyllanthi]QFY12074.1 extracellular solute-binding protein [Nonomuraea phyllanthi]
MSSFKYPRAGGGIPMMSRRAAFGLGLGAVAGAALTGCGSGGAPSSGAKKAAVPPPTYVAPPVYPGAVVPDVLGVPTAYPSVPKKLAKTVTETPGRGGVVRHFHLTWGPPATPLADNPWWQGLNERLGVEVKVTEVSAGNYDAKFATMLAGGDLPEVVQLAGGRYGEIFSAGCLKAIKQGAFADLSEILSGDKVMEYPNLANVRTEQWQACTINGGLWGVPIDIPVEHLEYRYRKDWAEKLGFPKPPADADETAELLVAMTKGNPEGSKKTWGLTAFPGMALELAYAMFGVPNNWKYEGGTLTHATETPQFEAAIAWLAKLWKSGGMHPDALALGTQTDRYRGFVVQGQVGMAVDSAANFHFPTSQYGKVVAKLDGAFAAFIPPGHDGSSKATFRKTAGVFGINAISAQAAKDKDRLAELLRLFNWRRGPVGSEEWYYQRWGADGEYFTRGADGEPVAVEGTNLDADRGAIAYGLTPQTWVFPTAKECVETNSQMVRQSVASPVERFRSDTLSARGAQLDQLFVTYIYQIVVGSRPLSDIEKYRQAWRSQGGDQIRREFQEQLKRN